MALATRNSVMRALNGVEASQREADLSIAAWRRHNDPIKVVAESLTTTGSTGSMRFAQADMEAEAGEPTDLLHGAEVGEEAADSDDTATGAIAQSLAEEAAVSSPRTAAMPVYTRPARHHVSHAASDADAVVARAMTQAAHFDGPHAARSARFAALEMPPLPAEGGPLYEETAAFMAANDPALRA